MRLVPLSHALAIATLLSAAPLLAQQPAPAAFTPPADVEYRKATIVSEGTRMAAEVFTPKTAAATAKLPCIVMAHGWGGVAASLRQDAMAFARAGYFVTTFDYRGWGASDARVVLTRPEPADRPGGHFTAEVQEVREVVDPIDFGTDWLNAIHWVVTEPQCDVDHLGLWGSSLSGGLVVWAAAREPRVKAIHSQVGAMDGRWVLAGAELARTRTEEAQLARGEVGYPTPGAVTVGNLRGAPVRAKFEVWTPVEEVTWAPHCAMQFVIAEKEELMDNRDNAIKAHARALGPKNLVTLPNITHYGVYREARLEAQRLALIWFDKYLKGKEATKSSDSTTR